MNLIQKLDAITYEMGKLESEVGKCGQASRTKKEIKAIANESRKKVVLIKSKIAGYRNNLVPLVAGDESNTVSDEVMAICEDVGNALFHLQNNEVDEACRILHGINMRTRGY